VIRYQQNLFLVVTIWLKLLRGRNGITIVRLDDDVVCFTDGSRNQGFTGASFYNQLIGENISVPLGTLCSVLQAEMYAILQCARSDDLCHRHSDSIAICNDSQAALKALASPKVTSAMVAETVAALHELAIHNSARLVWVPGHHGIPGNEVTDVLAKQASAQPYSPGTVSGGLNGWSEALTVGLAV